MDGDELDEFLRGDALKKSGIAVIKTHFPGKLALQLIRAQKIHNLCTIRDPRDCVASRQLFEKEPFERSVEYIADNLAHVDYYRAFSNTLILRYEEMMDDSTAQIKKILGYLEFKMNDLQIGAINSNTSISAARKVSSDLEYLPPETVFIDRSHRVDPLSQIHQNHINGGHSGRWVSELSNVQKEVIIGKFRPWLEKYGYETSGIDMET